MAYSLNTDGTVTLDTGEVISVDMSHEMLVNGQVVYKAVLTWETVTVEHHLTVDALDDAIATDLLLYMLGDPVTDGKLMLAQDVQNQINIRNFIAVTTAPQPQPTNLLAAAATTNAFPVNEPTVAPETLSLT